MTTKEYYEFHTQYGNRYDTDRQIIDMICPRKYSGVMDRRAAFISENQLLEKEDWMLFVEQFRSPVDDHDDGWRGEYFGKMMRGASMLYQYTRSKELYEVLTEVAERMLQAQDEVGRFSTYGREHEFNGWDIWARKYVILGFLHFHEICGDEELKGRIIEALERHLEYVIDHIGEGDKIPLDMTTGWWGGINSASILEPVMRMYNITGKGEYLDFAEYIIRFLTTSKVNIFTLALEDKLYPYEYPVTKAYEMMSCFEGLLEYYRVTGEEKWLCAVVNFTDKVYESDITLIGCAGCMHELFNHAVATQTDTDYDGIMQETCVTVTWMKLCGQLLLHTGDGKYADYMEESYYNALCGSVNDRQVTLNGGFVFDSYSPLTLGKRGRFIGGHKDIAEDKYYGCCVAIGAAGIALPLMSAAVVTKTGIAVNFYEKGTTEIGGFRLITDTEYPAAGSVKITVDRAGEGDIAFRIPRYASKSTAVCVNGEPFIAQSDCGYITIGRGRSAGDVIEISFDMNPRILRPVGVEGKEKSKNYLAVKYGPLVLARDAGFTEVGSAIPLSDRVEVEPVESDIDCVLRAVVTVGDTALDMMDYGSCGKSWDEDTLTEAWLLCE